jgi:hypothetical protein
MFTFLVTAATIELRPSRSIEDLRPWIACDIEDYKEADIDKMLAELLLRCTDTSKPTDKLSEKSYMPL